MVLGERMGDKSDSRYCGVETEFQEDMPQLLSFNLSSSAAFDFVVAPLAFVVGTVTFCFIHKLLTTPGLSPIPAMLLLEELAVNLNKWLEPWRYGLQKTGDTIKGLDHSFSQKPRYLTVEVIIQSGEVPLLVDVVGDVTLSFLWYYIKGGKRNAFVTWGSQQVETYYQGYCPCLFCKMDPTYRPSLMVNDGNGSGFLPVAGSDLVLSPAQWSSHVVGKISSWIDLDSEDEIVRLDSETTLKQEIAWASHLSLQACLLPTPKGASCANYARCVNQILLGLNNMQLWLRIPLEKIDDDVIDGTHDNLDGRLMDSWELWNTFRLLCEHHSQLFIALDILSSLPSANSLGRWFGEPVRAAIIHTDSFLTNARGYPCLSKRHQKLLTAFFNHSIQIVLSGKPVHSLPKESSGLGSNEGDGIQKHPLRSYLDYVGYLYQKMDPLPEQERFELGYRDFLQSPLQPLMDNLEAQTYETFEKDTMKYIQYQRAVSKALIDRIPDEKVSIVTSVLMVVGAGRGPLVRASLQAAEETGRKLKIYAVEKNPNAVITLHSLVKLEGWEDIVTIVSCDMRRWDAPEKADILVSELLGSFGDNELSPECLDGAQRFLKEDGISIPSSYTSFIQPVTTSKLYNDVKSHKDLLHFETAYVVKLHNVARLAPCKPVFTFIHPNHSSKNGNQRYKKLQFETLSDTGSAMVHGFAGYFDATLYKDVHLGIEPSTATPNMFSWFAIFFPLRTPVCIRPGATLEVDFWRCCGATKVWYEWCVTSPTPSPIHNPNGRSYWVGL